MNSPQTTRVEDRIVMVVQKAGGRLPLSDLVYHYKREYNLQFPPHVKLSDFVKKFSSIKLERNPKNNQTYVLNTKNKLTRNTIGVTKGTIASGKKIQKIEDKSDHNHKSKMIESRIILILKENNNRILLDHVPSKYCDRFNEELLIPAGMKLRKWFEKLSSISVDHDLLRHQVHLVLIDSINQEEKVLELLREHDGCVGLGSLIHIYELRYHEALLVPAGKRLSHWLCSMSDIVLTQKPSNNEAYVSLKHPIQLQYDKHKSLNLNNGSCAAMKVDSNKNVIEEKKEKHDKEMMNLKCCSSFSGAPLTMSTLQCDDSQEKKPHFAEDQSNNRTMPDTLHHSISNGSSSTNHKLWKNESDCITAESSIANISTRKQSSVEISSPYNHTSSLPITVKGQICSASTTITDTPIASLSSVKLTSEENIWEVIEDDQKRKEEELMAEAVRSLGYSLLDCMDNASVVNENDV